MLTLSTIRAAHHAADRRVVAPFLAGVEAPHDVPDGPQVLRALEERLRERPTLSFFQQGLSVAEAALRLAHDESLDGGERALCRVLGRQCAEFFARRDWQDTGALTEYDRASWLQKDELWRTLPWGTAFRGAELLRVYRLLGAEAFPDSQFPQSRQWWREKWEAMGQWIYGNPLIGSFPFNCPIDLCALLWGLGELLERPQWQEWALRAGKERIERDVDAQGWIHGENGGCSGHYQQVGAEFLARWAWESGDQSLLQTAERMFESSLDFATPSLIFPGNFGTRSAKLTPVVRPLILVAAARRDARAIALVRQSAQPYWSRDESLWEAALDAAQATAQTPETKLWPLSVQHFSGIQSSVVREGPFVAHFCNYERSLWARGFCNLWHRALDDMVFSTLHSLPSQVEKAKLHLDDTSDWAGFPHVRVQGQNAHFDSQQKIEHLVLEDSEGVTVRWDEYLTDADGRSGGAMRSAIHFRGEVLQMQIELSELVGPFQMDFHLLKRASNFIGMWNRAALEQMEAGRLPSQGGWHHDLSFEATVGARVGVQRDNAIFSFEIEAISGAVTASLGHLQNGGLHSANLGGVRLRLASNEAMPNFAVTLTFRCLQRPELPVAAAVNR